MFNQREYFKEKSIEEKVEEIREKINERLDKIEEQLNPPLFEKGDIVNFLLLGEEFQGEIIRKDGWNKNSWIIDYLDKSDVVQEVRIPEDEIWFNEEDCIGCLHNRISELETRLNKLETKK